MTLEEKRLYDREYCAKNREKKKLYDQQYRILNRDALFVKQAAYRAKPESRELTRLSGVRRQLDPIRLEKTQAQKAAHYQANRDKMLAKSSWYQAKPENRKLARKRYLKRRYGVTPEQVEQMTVVQNHACAICFRVLPLSVDHNHITGKVRALLCSPCNTAIGLLQESLTVLESAKSYLQKHTIQ